MNTITAYRTVPYGGDREKLAYLVFNMDTKRAHRYDVDCQLINITEPWYDDFYSWLTEYGHYWTLDPTKAYYTHCDPDLRMDDGL